MICAKCLIEKRIETRTYKNSYFEGMYLHQYCLCGYRTYPITENREIPNLRLLEMQPYILERDLNAT